MAALDYVLPPEHPAWRAEHDRAAALRSDPEAIRRLWDDPRTTVVAVGRGHVRVHPESGQQRLFTPATAPSGERVLLGIRDGAPCFAVWVDTVGSTGDARPIREVAATMPAADAALVLQATALVNWHETHPRCPRCGGITDVVQGGYARRCQSDGSLHFPRTDPAAIVLVLDESDSSDPAGRCLLARAAAWPERRMSALAGFVEPAETVEDAVRREVAEEVGVSVGEVRYAGSQPWPFPASLMLACYAAAVSTTLRPDGEEIVEARWFTRDEVRVASGSGDLVLPPAISVARRLVEGWVGEALPGEGAFRPA